jgi:hypothetical protein
MEESAPSETKEKTAYRERAEDAGAPTTLGSFAHTDRKRGIYCCVMIWKEGV